MKKVVFALAVMMLAIVGGKVNAARVQVSSEAELQRYLQSNPVVFLLISAKWCPHCKKMKPVVEQLTQELKNVLFVNIDADTGSLADKYAPQGFPTVKVYKNGRMVRSVVGEQSKFALRSLIG